MSSATSRSDPRDPSGNWGVEIGVVVVVVVVAVASAAHTKSGENSKSEVVATARQRLQFIQKPPN